MIRALLCLWLSAGVLGALGAGNKPTASCPGGVCPVAAEDVTSLLQRQTSYASGSERGTSRSSNTLTVASQKASSDLKDAEVMDDDAHFLEVSSSILHSNFMKNLVAQSKSHLKAKEAEQRK